MSAGACPQLLDIFGVPATAVKGRGDLWWRPQSASSVNPSGNHGKLPFFVADQVPQRGRDAWGHTHHGLKASPKNPQVPSHGQYHRAQAHSLLSTAMVLGDGSG